MAKMAKARKKGVPGVKSTVKDTIRFFTGAVKGEYGKAVGDGLARGKKKGPTHKRIKNK